MQIPNVGFGMWITGAEETLARHEKLSFADWLAHTFLWRVRSTRAGPAVAPARTNVGLRWPARTNGHPARCARCSGRGPRLGDRSQTEQGPSDNSTEGETQG